MLWSDNDILCPLKNNLLKNFFFSLDFSIKSHRFVMLNKTRDENRNFFIDFRVVLCGAWSLSRKRLSF